MALTAGTIFQIQASATTGNVNGAGFNIANANFPTDLATDTNTANTASPVFSSATYNFVAGDVGAYVYVNAGTHWQVGWYRIVSVASNKATVDAAIGTVVTAINGIGTVTRNTVAGCTSDNTATLTGGTYGVDYSRLDTAPINGVADFNAVGASTTLTSATAGFTPVMVGNFFHQTTTGTGAFGVVGWYEIVSYVNATTVVLDRTPNSGTASVNTTGYVGGAGRLNGLEDAFLEMIPASSIAWIKNGTYTTSAAVSVASTNSSSTSPSFLIGYNSLRGDSCVGSNRPSFACAANGFTLGVGQCALNLIYTGTAAQGFALGTSSFARNCKATNTSTTASRNALVAGTEGMIFDCEAISQMGNAVSSTGTRSKVSFCYLHDSVNGISTNVAGSIISGNIIEACDTAGAALQSTTGGCTVYGNTFYGREAKIGVGADCSGAANPNNKFFNNIFYGLTTGIQIATAEQKTNVGLNNNFYNNTTDVSNYTKDPTDTALDPQFVGATQITGSTATTSGSVLTQSGGDFSTVTDNIDVLHVISGTGVTVGRYLITSHTSTTLTVNNALGTSSGGDVVYYVPVGHNFAIGTNLKGIGFPSFANIGSEGVSYPDIGAMQRQEAAAGGGPIFGGLVVR